MHDKNQYDLPHNTPQRVLYIPFRTPFALTAPRPTEKISNPRGIPTSFQASSSHREMACHRESDTHCQWGVTDPCKSEAKDLSPLRPVSRSRRKFLFLKRDGFVARPLLLCALSLWMLLFLPIRPASAQQHLTQWSQWSPVFVTATSGPTLFREGAKAFQKGQYYKAKQLLQQALKKLPHWGLIHFELARAMQFNGDPPEEIAKHIKQATDMLPNNPRVFLFAGLYWEGQGQPKKALPLYLRAIRLGHYSAKPCLQAAVILISQQQASKALKCLQALQKQRPIPDILYRLLAKVYEQLQRWEDAGHYWIKALAKEPNNLTLLQTVFLFYKEHKPNNKAVHRPWQRTLQELQTRLRRMLPRAVKRNLRPLLPSRR